MLFLTIPREYLVHTLPTFQETALFITELIIRVGHYNDPQHEQYTRNSPVKVAKSPHPLS